MLPYGILPYNLSIQTNKVAEFCRRFVAIKKKQSKNSHLWLTLRRHLRGMYSKIVCTPSGVIYAMKISSVVSKKCRLRTDFWKTTTFRNLAGCRLLSRLVSSRSLLNYYFWSNSNYFTLFFRWLYINKILVYVYN